MIPCNGISQQTDTIYPTVVLEDELIVFQAFAAMFCEFQCDIFLFYRSEANDLALRLARAYTQHNDIVCIDKQV